MTSVSEMFLLVDTTRIVLPILERANEIIQNTCNNIGAIYIINIKIP